MKTRIFAAIVVAAALVAASGTASAAPYNLYGYFQRSQSGILSSLSFKAGAAQGCPNYGGPPATTNIQPCYNPSHPWTSSNGVATAIINAGQSTWDWNSGTNTLTQTGLLWGASFINSFPSGTAVVSDRVSNVVIVPGTSTNATAYDCVEGTFLATVNNNGCRELNLGANVTLDSPAAWNVGGNPKCVTLTINPDDFNRVDGTETPYNPGTTVPRGLTAQTAGQAGVGCAQTSGAFDLWQVIRDDGSILILANQANIGNCILFGAGPGPQAGPNPGQFGPGCPTDVAVANASYLVFVAPGAADTDGDGIANGIDNCIGVANPIQYDSNGDGYGNLCDADLNNSNTVTATDFNLLRSVLNQAYNASPLAAAADMNGSGTVTSTDFNLLRARLNTPPGPSGLH